ncbi:uncharacterized protein LOC126972452 [Leptidea sinapis]|uniref:O-acyltransferase WSD1 C-terminal domain-containing protein n=1 Tax=Leptidea sinapis TaxID=189913 RepID=A0A5E4R1C9_9NEOP|nr:uncharacterized protein LOC126972452 [Leptidea sinapis]VVD03247.1 unnamed protein product [Leptidea sinapis]
MEEINEVLNRSLQDLNIFNASEELRSNLDDSDGINEKNTSIFSVFVCILAVTLSFILGFEYDRVFNKVKIKIDVKSLLRTIVLTLLLLFLPVLLVLVTISLIYKCICLIAIKISDNNFVEFLHSFDVFWSLEDGINKNVIEVLGVIETDCPYALVDKIKEKISDTIGDDAVAKMFYRRHQKFGFFYWRKNNNIDVNEYVKVLKIAHKESLSTKDMENIMTDLSSRPLPFSGDGLFEILVTNIEVHNLDDRVEKYAIIFRIHHSVGDGIALIELLCKILADSKGTESLFKAPEIGNLFDHNLRRDYADIPRNLYKMALSFADGIIRSSDINALHGPSLEGKKLYKWIDTDENFLQIVKEIKKLQHVHFSDILTAALSNGLREYFMQNMLRIPDKAAVIIPIRLNSKKSLILENNFTVSILDLPLKEDLADISSSCEELRKSADPLTNHYLLKLCSVFPNSILKTLFNSSQATMVFSNIPGPSHLSLCGGSLQSLVFFAPNKGTTGVGVTALCYGDVLRFAIMADTALVARPDDLSLILEGMVKEIKRLHLDYLN